MTPTHNTGPIHNQVNNPIIHGDLVMYGERKVNRILTAVPSLSDPIIGREEALENLAATLTDAQRVVLVNGMGGIGKTTMATAYAQQNQAQFKHIAWIEQSGDFATDLITNTLLLRNLSLEITADPEADAKAILNALSNLAGPSLLVIDNADQKLAPFRDYLPKAPHWQVLITSREELDFAKILPLDFLSEQAATELFYSHYHHDKNEELLRDLLATIDYHTLTMELLAKIAQECAITTIAKITELLKARGLAIQRRASIRTAHSKEQRIEYLFPYLQAIFDIGDDFTGSQQQLLKYFVGLPPIPVPLKHLFTILLENPTNEATQDDLCFDLKELSRKGLLLRDDMTASFKMHRVIQDVIQKKYKVSEDDLGQVVSGVAWLLFKDGTKDNPIDKFPLVVYGEYLLSETFLSLDENADFVRLQSNLALVYQDLGRYAQAAGLLEHTLQSNLEKLVELDPIIAISRSNLALVYKNLGRYEEAKKLLECALQSDIDNYGELHPNVAIVQSNLGLVYKDLGRYEEAAALLGDALQSDFKIFGELHPSVAIGQSNLATVYQDLGRYEEAAELLECALRSNLENFGQFHPNVAIVQSNLGLVYKNLGHYKRAAILLEHALRSEFKNFGALHPNVATSQSNLGLVYKDLGRHEDAASLLKVALRSLTDFFGEQHPNVAICQSNLGLVYDILGRYEEAVSLLDSALRSDIDNYGELHPAVARNQSNLAIVYQRLGRHKKAAVLLEGALRSDIVNFGKEHPSVATTQSNLATAYQGLGRYEEAAALLEGALLLEHKNFGKLHPSVALNHWNLASVYISLERKKEAVNLLKSAYQIFLQRLGEDHPHTKGVKTWLDKYDPDL